jgi:hypothetical protein
LSFFICAAALWTENGAGVAAGHFPLRHSRRIQNCVKLAGAQGRRQRAGAGWRELKTCAAEIGQPARRHVGHGQARPHADFGADKITQRFCRAVGAYDQAPAVKPVCRDGHDLQLRSGGDSARRIGHGVVNHIDMTGGQRLFSRRHSAQRHDTHGKACFCEKAQLGGGRHGRKNGIVGDRQADANARLRRAIARQRIACDLRRWILAHSNLRQ